MLEAQPSLSERYMQWSCVRLAQRFIATPLRAAIDAALRAADDVRSYPPPRMFLLTLSLSRTELFFSSRFAYEMLGCSVVGVASDAGREVDQRRRQCACRRSRTRGSLRSGSHNRYVIRRDSGVA